MSNENLRPLRSNKRKNSDGFFRSGNSINPHNNADGFVVRRPIMQPLARRRIGDFNQSEGYHSAKQPTLTSQNSDLENSQPSMLGKDLSAKKHLPLLGSKDGRDRRKLPKASFRKRAMKWSKRAVVSLAVLSVVVGGFLAVKGYIKLHQIFGGNSVSALASNPGRINILLLGIGGAGHDGPDLTDTMMVASIDPVNDRADLLSVPRDLWVKMPNNYEGYYQKINAAYEAGKYSYLNEENSSSSNRQAVFAGFKSVDSVVSQVLGIPINYNALVDFQAFEQAVNTLGGITIDVPTELYDPTMAWQNNWNPILAEPGVQTMDGYKALLYVRSRETTSDFARTQRQRAVLVDIKNKALTLGTLSNPLKISGLISAFGDNVRTDMSLNDAETLYGIMKKINNNNIKSLNLADPPNNFFTTSSVDGLSVVLPSAGEFNYNNIQAYLRLTLRDGHLAKENAKVMVINGTAVPGLAENVANYLKSYGYTISGTGNVPDQKSYLKTEVVDLTRGQDKYTIQDLDSKFKTTTVSKLPDSSIQPSNADFVIIVGEDEATSY